MSSLLNVSIEWIVSLCEQSTVKSILRSSSHECLWIIIQRKSMKKFYQYVGVKIKYIGSRLQRVGASQSIKKSARYSQVFVVIEFVVSGTQCN